MSVQMNARAILKSAAPFIAHYSGIGRALAFHYAGPGTIFVLHSIVGDIAHYPDHHIRCSVAALERILRWLRDQGVEFVSLDEAVERLERSSTGRFCVFTFDDGYADNLTHALPVMARFDAPFTVYVATGMVSGEIDAWWLGLARLIRTRERLELPELDCSFDCSDPASKKRTYLAITTHIDSNSGALAAVRTAIAASGIDCHELARAEGLNAEQLRRLAASPLVTIGAHGVRHIHLARATVAEVEREMTASRRFLQDIIEREVVHFAYPFGACGPREAQIARSVGFRTAVTTQRGTLFSDHLAHRYALPREPISANDTSASLRYKIDGTYRALHSRFGDPVVHMDSQALRIQKDSDTRDTPPLTVNSTSTAAEDTADRAAPRVCLCVPTFRRPEGLRKLLSHVARLTYAGPISVIVVDNDARDRAGAKVVEGLSHSYRFPLTCILEPRRGLTYASNCAFANACRALPAPTYIAVLDDDEYPEPNWLTELMSVALEHDVDIVGGPVFPVFDTPDHWLASSGLYAPLRFATGRVAMIYGSGNMLIRRSILEQYLDEPFLHDFAFTGGGDLEFFWRCRKHGRSFAWADSAHAFETTPQARTTLSYLLRRRFRNGAESTCIERMLYSKSIGATLRRWYKALGLLGLGMLSLPISAFGGRRAVVSSLVHVARGAGRIAAEFGILYEEYQEPR